MEDQPAPISRNESFVLLVALLFLSFEVPHE